MKDKGIRDSNKKITNLVDFLCIDPSVYTGGLVIKKIDKVMKEFASNEYLKSIGSHKKENKSKG